VIEDKAEAAYRRGDLFEKRRKLMEAWAVYCAAPKAGEVEPVPTIATDGGSMVICPSAPPGSRTTRRSTSKT
jgi:hypothetical protein